MEYNLDPSRMGMRPKLDDGKLLACQTCGSQWFEMVTVSRHSIDTPSILGQEPPAVGMSFKIHKCVRCGDLQEPVMYDAGTSPRYSEYAQLLETLEGQGDTRTPEEEPVVTEQETSQEEVKADEESN